MKTVRKPTMTKDINRYAAISFLLIASSIFPALLAFSFVLMRALPIPVGDQWWDTVHIAVLTRQGNLSAADILAYSEGHRLAVVRILTWLMTIFSGYSPYIANSFTWFISAINIFLAYRLFCSQQFHDSKPTLRIRLTGLALFSSTLFCISHGQNWIDFYFSQWQLSLLFVLLAGNLIASLRISWFSFASILSTAILASFSIGLGLGSWVAIPVMAASRRGYRKASFLALWVCFGFFFASFYFSDYARNGATPSPGLGNMGSPKSIILLIGLYLSRRFIADPSDSIYVIVVLLFSLTCLLLFVCIALLMWKRGFGNMALPWVGIAIYSLIGSVMIYISRRGIMPSERHSPGSDGFWIALVGIAISYFVLDRTSRHFSEVIYRNVMLSLVSIALGCLWVLGVGRTLATFMQNAGDWTNPTYFSRSCVDSARLHPLNRNLDFRKCFVFGDERSTYQLALMGLGNMEPKPHQLPMFNDQSVTTITIFPSRLMSAYFNRFMLKQAPQVLDSSKHKSYQYTPLYEKPIMRPWPTPLTTHMHWDEIGNGKRLAKTYNSFETFLNDISRLRPATDSILLIAGAEMTSEVNLLKSSLAKMGFVDFSSISIERANHLFPSLKVVCFAGLSGQFSSSKDQPCSSPDLIRLPSAAASSISAN